jgi:hypothetical protein
MAAKKLMIISGTAGNTPFNSAFDTTTPAAATEIGTAIMALLTTVPDGSTTSVTVLVVQLVNG